MYIPYTHKVRVSVKRTHTKKKSYRVKQKLNKKEAKVFAWPSRWQKNYIAAHSVRWRRLICLHVFLQHRERVGVDIEKWTPRSRPRNKKNRKLLEESNREVHRN